MFNSNKLVFVHGTFKQGHKHYNILLRKELEMKATFVIAMNHSIVEPIQEFPYMIASHGRNCDGQVLSLSATNIKLMSFAMPEARLVKITTISNLDENGAYAFVLNAKLDMPTLSSYRGN